MGGYYFAEENIEIFGCNVKSYSDVFRSNGNISVAFSESSREQHKFKLGYEVLRDTYTLSKCDILVAGLSNVSYAARILKK